MLKAIYAVLWSYWITFLIAGICLVLCSALNMAIYAKSWSDLELQLKMCRDKEKELTQTMFKVFVVLCAVTVAVIAVSVPRSWLNALIIEGKSILGI